MSGNKQNAILSVIVISYEIEKAKSLRTSLEKVQGEVTKRSGCTDTNIAAALRAVNKFLVSCEGELDIHQGTINL